MKNTAASSDSDQAITASREVVGVDGKTMRRSHDRARDESPLHVVSAWASTAGVSLGQVAVAEKSNEITAIPALVRLLCLTHCIVTIDAPRNTRMRVVRRRSPACCVKPKPITFWP